MGRPFEGNDDHNRAGRDWPDKARMHEEYAAIIRDIFGVTAEELGDTTPREFSGNVRATAASITPRDYGRPNFVIFDEVHHWTPEPEPLPRCATCIFRDELNGLDVCRREPPSGQAVAVIHELERDWCGEHATLDGEGAFRWTFIEPEPNGE